MRIKNDGSYGTFSLPHDISHFSFNISRLRMEEMFVRGWIWCSWCQESWIMQLLKSPSPQSVDPMRTEPGSVAPWKESHLDEHRVLSMFGLVCQVWFLCAGVPNQNLKKIKWWRISVTSNRNLVRSYCFSYCSTIRPSSSWKRQETHEGLTGFFCSWRRHKLAQQKVSLYLLLIDVLLKDQNTLFIFISNLWWSAWLRSRGVREAITRKHLWVVLESESQWGFFSMLCYNFL